MAKHTDQDSIVDFPGIQAIKQEAALWAVRMQGYTYKTDSGIPPEQARELKAWLDQSERHREAFITMAAGWDAMAVMEDLADIIPVSDFVPPQSASDTRASAAGPWAWSPFAAMASVMLCVLVAWSLLSPQQPQLYRTAIGEQASYTLADGSVVTLNTASQLRVDYSDQRRAVTLLQGEAHFDVAKNPERPFMVYADQGMVWAVGTAFTVHYRQDYVDVTVTEGRVKVYAELSQPSAVPKLSPDLSPNPPPAEQTQPREALLLAGEQAAYKQSILSQQSLPPTRLEKKLAWRSGALVFKGETLAQAMAEIARYTDRELIITDPALAELTVGGRFKTDDIDELLLALAASLNLKAEAGAKQSLRFSARQ